MLGLGARRQVGGAATGPRFNNCVEGEPRGQLLGEQHQAGIEPFASGWDEAEVRLGCGGTNGHPGRPNKPDDSIGRVLPIV
jgi:hypothetical protein